jgi:hypothetical protein
VKTKYERELEDARYEAERLRDQLEAKERRDAREQREREERRKQERRERDPSNRLYNGDVRDFHEAVECHLACCQREITQLLEGDSPELRECTVKCNDAMREGIAKANSAREIYDRIVTDAKKNAVAAMREAGLTEWADCVESGDYSSMAI